MSAVCTARLQRRQHRRPGLCWRWLGAINRKYIAANDVLVIKMAPDGIKLEFVKSAIAAVTTEDVAKA